MAKKLDTKGAMDKFFTTDEKHDKYSESDKHNKSNKPQKGRPPKTPEEKLRGYRYNLNLDRDLKGYLHEIAWRNRTSITQYINDLIRTDMEAYIAAGGSEEEWASWNEKK